MLDLTVNKSVWLLVYTKPNQETIAKTNLENQEFIVFLPMLKVSYDTEDLAEVRRVLFPRYLFVQADLQNDNWTSIKSTKGISHLITFGNKSAHVPTSLIEELINITDKEGNFCKKVYLSRFSKGDKVNIKKGVLKEKIATFIEYQGKNRARILLEFMNSKISVDVLISAIQKKENLEEIKL